VLANETDRNTESIVSARRAIAIKDSLGERRDKAYLGLLNTLAAALDGEGKLREAVQVYHRAIAAMDSSGRGGMLSRAIMRHDLALTLIKLGRIAEAERILHEVLEQSARSDQSGRINWQPVIHYAETALTQGRADSAAKYFRAIVDQAVRDSSLYWEGRGLFGLARAQIRLGQLTQARRAKVRLERIVELHPKVRGTDDQVPDGHTLDGSLYLAAGDAAAAKEEFLLALKANGYFEGKRKARLRPVVLLAAECDLVMGRAPEAVKWAREALAIALVDSLAERESAAVGAARLVEAKALLATGDSAGGRVAAERARVALRVGAGPAHELTQQAEALVMELEG
jgi:tetratricopeptide (TPR) repeat protein